MRLSEIMSTPVATVSISSKLGTVREEMRRRKIHHLVVLDGKRVAGVVSARDLTAADDDLDVVDKMAAPVVTAGPDTTLREAANLLRGHAVGCLPVTDRGKLVGILTVSDLLELVGKGVERPIEMGKRWTLKHRGPRQRRMRR